MIASIQLFRLLISCVQVKQTVIINEWQKSYRDQTCCRSSSLLLQGWSLVRLKSLCVSYTYIKLLSDTCLTVYSAQWQLCSMGSAVLLRQLLCQTVVLSPSHIQPFCLPHLTGLWKKRNSLILLPSRYQTTVYF